MFFDVTYTLSCDRGYVRNSLLNIKPRRFLSLQPVVPGSARHEERKISLWVFSERTQASLGIFNCKNLAPIMKHKAVSVQKQHDPRALIKSLTSSSKVKNQQAAYLTIQVTFLLKEGNRMSDSSNHQLGNRSQSSYETLGSCVTSKVFSNTISMINYHYLDST